MHHHNMLNIKKTQNHQNKEQAELSYHFSGARVSNSKTPGYKWQKPLATQPRQHEIQRDTQTLS